MERVVVTGYGVVSPLGNSAAASWEAATAGRSGAGPITLFDTNAFDVKIACEVKEFDPAALLNPRQARRQDRFEQFANVAATEALAHSGLEIGEAGTDRVGVAISSAFGGLASMEHAFGTLAEAGPRRLDPLGLTKFMTTTPSVSIAHGLRGPSFSAASACASGADGIGLAMRLIQAGDADAMLAGGADAPVTALSIGTFARMGACTRRSECTPSPFSADRDGLVVGEGAGVVVLESLTHAQRRGASILAEVAGYGSTTDAFHLTAPLDTGEGSAAAIRKALNEARLNPGDLGYINAHGTGTSLNDAAETRALKAALGSAAYDVPVSSTKSMTGHMMAGSGAVEAILCIQTLRSGVVPPTINYRERDEACDLDYVPNQARERRVSAAMSNAFGFGGHNAVLVFRKFEE